MNSTIFLKNSTLGSQICEEPSMSNMPETGIMFVGYFGSFVAALAVGLASVFRRKIVFFISLGVLFLAILVHIGIYFYKNGSPIYIPGLKGYLVENQFINGALFLSGIGLITYYAQQIGNWFMDMFYYKYVSTIVINNRNPVYPWLLDFIDEKTQGHPTHRFLETIIDLNDGIGTLTHEFSDEYKMNYFYYNNRWVQVIRGNEANSFGTYHSKNWKSKKIDRYGNVNNGAEESLKLITYNVTTEFWQELLDSASKEALKDLDDDLIMYEMNTQGYYEWSRTEYSRPKRPLDSVILEGELVSNIVKDVENFLNRMKTYEDLNIPYRRGYLFYGPPGTGKTSFIAALASHFGYGICYLSLSDTNLNDQFLIKLLNDFPKKCFIIIEDIDIAFPSREKKKKDEENNDNEDYNIRTCYITKAGLINAIDGIRSDKSSSGRILFMTTNHRENLDPAMIRRGRADFQAYFGYCTKDMAERMFKRFYSKIDDIDRLCEQFVDAAFNLAKEFTPVQLQNHLLYYINEAEEAVKNIEALIEY